MITDDFTNVEEEAEGAGAGAITTITSTSMDFTLEYDGQKFHTIEAYQHYCHDKYNRLCETYKRLRAVLEEYNHGFAQGKLDYQTSIV
jgi:hypothetical protein